MAVQPSPAASVRDALSRLRACEAALGGTCLDVSSFAWGSPSAAQQQHQLYQLAFMFCSMPHAAGVGAALCSPYGAFPPQVFAPPQQQQQPAHHQQRMPAYAPLPHHQACYLQPAPAQHLAPAPATYHAAATAAPGPGASCAAPPSAARTAPAAPQQPAASAPLPTPPPQPAPCTAKAAAKAATASTAQPPRSHSKKSGGGSKASKAAAQPAAVAASTAPPVAAFGPPKAADIELDAEDIRKLLEDDRDFLQFHEDEGVGSEGGSNGCSADGGRLLVRTGSRGSLSANGALNDNILFDGSLASAFDMDIDEQATGPGWPAGSAASAPGRATSADLNNLACSSPSSPVKAQPGGPPAKLGKAGAATKVTLRVKGGVQKTAGAAAGPAAAKAVAAGGKATKAASSAAAAAAAAAAAVEEALTAADLSRLLGEDDSRIPDGWDLDLDFENPFSTPISAL